MKGFCAALLATLMLVGIAGQAVAQVPAVEIFYDLQNLGGARWQYIYTVQNNTLTHTDPTGYWGEEGVTMFEVYLPARQDTYSDIKTSDAAFFSALAVTGVPDPNRWDLMAVHAEPTLWIPPVAKAVYALNAFAIDKNDATKIHPVLTRQSVTGFSVAFDYSGTGAPGDQQFSVIDPSDYFSYFDGRTEPKHVPEPAGLLLLGAGMFGVALRKRSGS